METGEVENLERVEVDKLCGDEYGYGDGYEHRYGYGDGGGLPRMGVHAQNCCTGGEESFEGD